MLDDAGQECTEADEVRHLARRGLVIEPVRRIPLLDVPGLHHADVVGEREGLVLVVRDEQGGGAGALEDVAQIEREPLAQVGVEVREGLVEQQDRRRRRQRARERDALLLAARELVRIARARSRQPDQLEHLAHAPLAFGRRAAAQAEADVGRDVEMREQGVVLEHDAHAAPLGLGPLLRRRDALRVDVHAAFVGPHEPGDRAQRRRLAAAGRAEQAADLAGAQPKGETVQCRHPGACRAEGDAQRLDLQRPRATVGRVAGIVAGAVGDRAFERAIGSCTR